MQEKLRIAQIAPLAESVPPRLYGGTERVVAYLTDALIDAGHDVTLFASADSQTRARLVSGSDQALRLAGLNEGAPAFTLAMLEEVMRRAEEFDVIHSHVDLLGFPLYRRLEVPVVTTLHGRLDAPELQPLFDEYDDMALVSISDHQRRPLPQALWLGTVYHGLPLSAGGLHSGRGDYLAFLGRVSPEKGLESAIDIAIRTGRRLKIAAKIDDHDRKYYETVLRPRFDHPLVEFIGEIGEDDKADFLGQAAALIFMIDWPEPFGLVMIEAMSCGTPVIARRRGSVPEIIDEGVTGFVCETDDEAVEAVGRLALIDRARCRATFERRFSAPRMAEDYVRLYRRLVEVHRRMATPLEGSRAVGM